MERQRKIKIDRGLLHSETPNIEAPHTETPKKAREGLGRPHSGLPDRPAPFDQRYARTTTYLENYLHDRLHDLLSSRAIPSIVALINAAIKEYLDRHYPNQ